MANTLVLEDATMRRILRNSVIVAEFPFMRAAAEKVTPKARRGCGSCGAKNRVNTTDFNGIKAAIAGMPIDRKARFKQLLEIDEIRLYYTNVKRQKIKMTF